MGSVIKIFKFYIYMALMDRHVSLSRLMGSIDPWQRHDFCPRHRIQSDCMVPPIHSPDWCRVNQSASSVTRSARVGVEPLLGLITRVLGLFAHL
jgi:hypothetical protein